MYNFLIFGDQHLVLYSLAGTSTTFCNIFLTIMNSTYYLALESRFPHKFMTHNFVILKWAPFFGKPWFLVFSDSETVFKYKNWLEEVPARNRFSTRLHHTISPYANICVKIFTPSGIPINTILSLPLTYLNIISCTPILVCFSNVSIIIIDIVRRCAVYFKRPHENICVRIVSSTLCGHPNLTNS